MSNITEVIKTDEDLNEIYRLYANKVYRYIVSLCLDKNLAEDILRNTMLKAFKNIDRFMDGCSVKTWLCSITRSEYINHLKKPTKKLPLDENKTAESNDPYREILTFRFYCELKFSEIGEMFGKSENWVYVNFSAHGKGSQNA